MPVLPPFFFSFFFKLQYVCYLVLYDAFENLNIIQTVKDLIG